MSEHAGVARTFFFCLYSSCVRAGMTQFALVVAVFFEVFDIRDGHFGVFNSQRHFTSCFSSFPLCTGPGTHCHP